MPNFEQKNTRMQDFEATKEALKKGNIDDALKSIVGDTENTVENADNDFKEKLHIAELIKQDEQKCCDIISGAFPDLQNLVLQ